MHMRHSIPADMVYTVPEEENMSRCRALTPEERNKRAFLATARGAVREVLACEVFKFLERGRLRKAQWQVWGLQRHKAGELFIALLETACHHCDDQGLWVLAGVLADNLDDERGVIDGVVNEEEAHSTWRSWFYESLGLSDADLKKTEKLTVGLALCRAETEYLINFGNAFEIAGALLFLELLIPMEFQLVRTGLYPSFPSEYTEDSCDDDETRARKRRARRYLDDHIEHDSRDHFPRLLDALAGAVRCEEDKLDVINGIKEMASARGQFYKDLASCLRPPVEKLVINRSSDESGVYIRH